VGFALPAISALMAIAPVSPIVQGNPVALTAAAVLAASVTWATNVLIPIASALRNATENHAARTAVAARVVPARPDGSALAAVVPHRPRSTARGRMPQQYPAVPMRTALRAAAVPRNWSGARMATLTAVTALRIHAAGNRTRAITTAAQMAAATLQVPPSKSVKGEVGVYLPAQARTAAMTAVAEAAVSAATSGRSATLVTVKPLAAPSKGFGHGIS
jgi:hypothetical protein